MFAARLKSGSDPAGAAAPRTEEEEEEKKKARHKQRTGDGRISPLFFLLSKLSQHCSWSRKENLVDGLRSGEEPQDRRPDWRLAAAAPLRCALMLRVYVPPPIYPAASRDTPLFTPRQKQVRSSRSSHRTVWSTRTLYYFFTFTEKKRNEKKRCHRLTLP